VVRAALRPLNLSNVSCVAELTAEWVEGEGHTPHMAAHEIVELAADTPASALVSGTPASVRAAGASVESSTGAAPRTPLELFRPSSFKFRTDERRAAVL